MIVTNCWLPLGTLRASRLYSTESGRTSLCDSDVILDGGVIPVLLFWSYTNTNFHCTQQQPGALPCFFTLQTKLPLNIWISVQFWVHSGLRSKVTGSSNAAKVEGIIGQLHPFDRFVQCSSATEGDNWSTKSCKHVSHHSNCSCKYRLGGLKAELQKPIIGCHNFNSWKPVVCICLSFQKSSSKHTKSIFSKGTKKDIPIRTLTQEYQPHYSIR